ncbi:sensor domain-containing protein [Micromonospora endophytica]|uniref:sensor domain-containing protein n=1 Tax=Micromonospora endophytica TaxID=515350 RepID=UPI001CB910D6|nr:sensor domain-containing protein [Micromonospora endophytica]
MTTAAPTHLAQAMRRRRYPLTGWPWRALAYLLTSVPLAGVLSLGPLVVLAPLFAATSAARQGRPVSLPLTVFLTVGALTVLALAPLLAVPVAAFERYRLGLVDDRPLPPTPWRGFVARYTTGAAWREAAYLFLLGTVVPAVYWLFILLVTLVLLLVASPFVVSPGEQVRVLWSTAETPGQAVPYAIVGVLLLPVLWTRSACSPPPRARWPGGCSARTAPR